MPALTQSPDAQLDRAARMRLMGIDETTSALLQDFWRVVEPRMPVILDAFYAHLRREPALAALLGDETPRLKRVQANHWARLFDGQFDEAYMRGVQTIGRVHNCIGLKPRWYICGYNFVLAELTGLAVRHYRFRPR